MRMSDWSSDVCSSDLAAGAAIVLFRGLPLDRHQLPGVAQLALRVVGLRQPDRCAGLGQAQHGAGIGAVGYNLGTVLEHHVGQETLVAAQQAARKQRLWKLHRAGLSSGVVDWKSNSMKSRH